MSGSRYWLSLIVLIIINPMGLAFEPQVKQHSQARRHLNNARELDSSNDPRAEQEYILAIEARSGNYPQALEEFASYLQRRQRFAEAAEVLKEYINQTPQVDHADDIDNLRDLERAATLEKRINASDKPDLSELIEFASLVARYGKPKEGIPFVEMALDLYPTSSEAQLLLARLLIGSGQQQRRLDLLQKALELDPDNPKTHHQLGWYYIEMLRSQEAADEFRKALKFSNGQLADAWQGLGWALSQLGQKKEALEAFRNYLHAGDVSRQYRLKIKQQIKKLERGS